MSRESDIEALLSRIDPDVTVQATPDADGSGSRIIMEVDGQTYWFSIGPRRSALLNYLLTGHAT